MATRPFGLKMTNQTGGAQIHKASKLVMNCFATDPKLDFPHVGDIQWLFHGDEQLDNPDNWRFWQDATGQDIGMCWLHEDEFNYVIHPQADSGSLVSQIRDWGLNTILDRAKEAGEASFTVWETAVSDDIGKTNLLLKNGYKPRSYHYLKMGQCISEPLSQPKLPDGFTVRHVQGEDEAQNRASLHRDSFLPYSSKTLEIAIDKQLRAMRTPFYDPTLDLMIIAPDGTPACGGICWFDRVNKTGLFEPVGTRPAFRRMGLARALMLIGLQRLQQKGATYAFVSSTHPGSSGDKFPIEFTSSRHAFQQAGFEILRENHLYNKEYLLI